MGLVAPWHVESSWTRDWTCVPWISRWILNYWTTREVPRMFRLSVLFDVNSCTYNKILTVRYQVEFWKILYINIGIAQASTKTYRQHCKKKKKKKRHVWCALDTHQPQKRKNFGHWGLRVTNPSSVTQHLYVFRQITDPFRVLDPLIV